MWRRYTCVLVVGVVRRKGAVVCVCVLWAFLASGTNLNAITWDFMAPIEYNHHANLTHIGFLNFTYIFYSQRQL